MKLNENEKYLLKFMANGTNESPRKNELIKLIYKFGLKLNFYNTNPINQIIDEMDFDSRIANLTGRKYE